MMLPLAFLPEKRFMLRALSLAEEAAAAGEVPVGAVVVKDGQVIGEGRNRREEGRTALAHAEVEAIVVYGADDERAGCCGTAADLFSLPYSHRPEVYRGFFEAEAKALLQEFFQKLRE